MTTTAPAHVRSLGLLKESAERVAGEAKHLADSLRAEYARLLIAEAFPEHTLAIFARNWDEEKPMLIQLLAGQTDIADLDLQEDPELDSIAPEKRKLLIEAERAIQVIGSDDDILRHLSPGETEHGDWTEFQLVLHPEDEA